MQLFLKRLSLAVAAILLAGVIAPNVEPPAELPLMPHEIRTDGSLREQFNAPSELDRWLLANGLLEPVTLEAQGTRAPVRLIAPYRVTVGTSAEQVTDSGNVNGGVVIKAICPGQTIYVGVSSSVTTSTGYPLSDGETLTLEVRNANALYVIASAAAQSVAVLPFSRY